MDFAKTLQLIKDAETVGEGGRQRELVAAAIKDLAAQLRYSEDMAGTHPRHIQEELNELVSE